MRTRPQIPNPDRRYAIKLWSTLKSDRGRVNIYCGSTKWVAMSCYLSDSHIADRRSSVHSIGAASQYSSGGETTSRVFWSGSK